VDIAFGDEEQSALRLWCMVVAREIVVRARGTSGLLASPTIRWLLPVIQTYIAIVNLTMATQLGSLVRCSSVILPP